MTLENRESLPSYAVRKGSKYGFDDIIAHLIYSQEKQIKFANSDIALSSEWQHLHMELFLTQKKKLLTTAIENPTKTKIVHALQQGKKQISLVSPKQDYHGIGTGGSYETYSYDKELIHQDEELLSVTQMVIDIGNEYVPEVAGILRVSQEEVTLCSSHNVHAEDKNSWITLSMRALGKDSSGHGVQTARTMKQFTPLKAAHKAGTIAREAASPQGIKTGKYTIIFDPLSLGNLVSQFIDFSSIFSIESGFSCLIGKLEQRVAHEKINLFDDGSHPLGIHTQKFDAEGTPTKKTPIIKDGILKNYLHNISTAKKYKTESTGNAGLIAPHPWTGVLSPGDRKKEEIFNDITSALYITNVWYTRFQNYLTGDFSTIPRDGAFIINKGDMVKSVHNIRISDNLASIFAHMEILSDTVEQIYWWETETPSFVPYAVVKNVNITTSMG
jgi:PmbA protein